MVKSQNDTFHLPTCQEVKEGDVLNAYYNEPKPDKKGCIVRMGPDLSGTTMIEEVGIKQSKVRILEKTQNN